MRKIKVTTTDEKLVNIPKERMDFLFKKCMKIENDLKFLKEEDYYLFLGIPRKYDNKLLIDEAVDDCLASLNKIMSEVRFLSYAVRYDMPVSLN